MSFQHYSGQDCTILVSKAGGKYRLQSDHIDAMWLSLHVSGGRGCSAARGQDLRHLGWLEPQQGRRQKEGKRGFHRIGAVV